MRKNDMMVFLRTCALAAVLVFGGAAIAGAQDAGSALPIERLKTIADQTIAGADRYLSKASTTDRSGIESPDLVSELEAYRRFAEQLRTCMAQVRKALVDTDRFATQETFKARFEAEEREELLEFDDASKKTINEISKCRRDRLLLEDGKPPCCPGIQSGAGGLLGRAIKPEVDFSLELVEIWRGYSDRLGGSVIAETERVLERFDRKLIDGFPGMPWEYVFNIMGDINGPSPHQIIWAHFNLGFEDGVQVTPGDNRIQPVLTLQGLGYNRYFLSKDKGVWRKLNYLGVAGIITLNGRKGVTAVRYGGVVHFGNYVSVGSTYGDGAWRVYASSNKVVDQVLRIWN